MRNLAENYETFSTFAGEICTKRLIFSGKNPRCDGITGSVLGLEIDGSKDANSTTAGMRDFGLLCSGSG